MAISIIVLISLNITSIPNIAALTVPNSIKPIHKLDTVFFAIVVNVFSSIIPRMFTVPGTIVFPVAPLANVFKTADFSAGNMTWSHSASRSFWVYIPLVANDDGAEYCHVWRTSGRSSCGAIVFMGFGTNLCQSPSILYSVVIVGCMLQSPMEFREIVVTLRWLPLQSYPTRPYAILMRVDSISIWSCA
ncbi:uncharacterized protein LOC143302775 isoform X1 [Bombus vancouverensis nearcticus]|uniref:uncharacterized protein LOC143302768 isoform X1 n=2 Tax=Bombus vancouverensis nearcticus TaxID=2705178 RepID=UPI00402BABD7